MNRRPYSPGGPSRPGRFILGNALKVRGQVVASLVVRAPGRAWPECTPAERNAAIDALEQAGVELVSCSVCGDLQPAGAPGWLTIRTPLSLRSWCADHRRHATETPEQVAA